MPADLTLAQFLNALKILRAIDMHELKDAGACPQFEDWLEFARDPYKWMMKSSDEDAAKVWRIIVARSPNEREKAAP